MKNIKQLGLTYLIIENARGSRFDHCIGTYYLADKTLNALEKNTKDLQIPDFYRKSVNIAALLHDVGHGPFSHTWEYICDGNYHHEENARTCVDIIFKDCLSDWKVDQSYAKELIKGLIEGDRSCLRDKQYGFLFDVVNNKTCDVDVDKWDYLLRDCKLAYDSSMPKVNMDFEDVFLNARASDDRSRIEFRYCDFRKIYDIFETRSIFHIHIYQPPKNICMEMIMKHIMFACENDLETINGRKLKDIQSKYRDAFLKFHDDEIWRNLKTLKRPREIVELIYCLENAKKSLLQIHPKTEDEKVSIPDYLKPKIRIAYAGEKLNSENIPFYGNEEEKPSFAEQKGFYESTSYFQVIPFNNSS